MNRRGMTLIELVVGLTVTGLVLSAGYAAFSSVTDHRARAEGATRTVSRAAAARRTLSRWLEGAWLTVDDAGPPFQGLDVGEGIRVTGTPFGLHYRSNRVPGQSASRSLRIPLTGSSVPSSLKRVDLEVYVAGQVILQTLAGLPNLVTTVTWDGKDGYARPVQGQQPARVRIGYVYDAVYQTPAQQAENFAQFSGTGVTTIRTRQEIIAWQEQTATFGNWDATGAGLGGWTLSAHHAYDPVGQVLYYGDGRRRDAQNINAAVSHFAGTGTAGGSGNGGPATQAQLNAPTGVAVAPDGSVIIVERSGHRIRKVSPTGVISTIAGTGSAGYSGDNGPATQAQIHLPHTPEIGPDGSIYFGDQNNARVRRVSPTGIITTVAGTGTIGFSGDGGLATGAMLSQNPRDVVLSPDGSLYILDGVNQRIRRVSPSGIIRTIVGDGVQSYGGDNGPAILARIHLAEALALAPDGSLWFTDGATTGSAGSGSTGSSAPSPAPASTGSAATADRPPRPGCGGRSRSNLPWTAAPSSAIPSPAESGGSAPTGPSTPCWATGTAAIPATAGSPPKPRANPTASPSDPTGACT